MSNSNDHKKAFLALYEPVECQISNYCRALTGEEESARDLLQDTLLAAYENFKTLRKPESFLFFLCAVAKRIFLKQFRRKKLTQEFLKNEHEEYISYNKGESNIEAGMLYHAIGHLPVEQREALVMFEIMGFSLDEIRKHQGGSLSGVKSRIVRARQKLAEMLFTVENKKVGTQPVKTSLP